MYTHITFLATASQSGQDVGTGVTLWSVVTGVGRCVPAGGAVEGLRAGMEEPGEVVELFVGACY